MAASVPPPTSDADAAPTGEPRQPSFTWHVWAACSGLTLLAFGPMLFGGMVAEDFYFIPRYLEVPFSDTLRAKWLLQTSADDPETGFQFYRPLAYMWLHAKILFWNGWRPGLRIDHLILNVIFGLSVGHLAFQWTRDRATAITAALLAVLSPGHMRFMPAIYGTGVLLPALAAIWAVLAYTRGIVTQSTKHILLGTLASIVGLLCYEQIIVIPLLGILVAVVLHRPVAIRRLIVPGVAAAVVTAGYLLFRVRLFGDVGGYKTVEGEPWFALHAPFLLAKHFLMGELSTLQSLIWPFQSPVVATPMWLNWVFLLVACSIVIRTAIRSRGAAIPLGVGVLWILVTTLPVAQLLQRPTGWDHYVFISSVGSTIIVAVCIHAITSAKVRRAALAFFLVLYTTHAWVSFTRWWPVWELTERFTEDLQATITPEDTPAIVYVRNLPSGAGLAILPFFAPENHERYTGYLRNRLFLRQYPLTWAYTAPYSGDAQWPPADDLQLHWTDWNEEQLSLSRVDGPQPIAGTEHTWNFSEVQPYRPFAWRSAHQLRHVDEARIPPVYITEGKFALLSGPRLPEDLGTPVYADVTMAVQSPAGDRGVAEWQWRIADSAATSPAHIVRFWVEEDGAPHTYRVPLVNNPMLLLDEPAVRVDFRPTNTSGAIVQVHSISLVPRTGTSD